ncbi:MAG: Ig-like domain-containing protein [Geobacteraceae bacterium]|nr:Ig-like domain-containing protein [Geobacteraceae bacterium]
MTVAFAVLLTLESGCFAVTVTLNWGASAGSTGYRVYYRADSATLPFSGTGATQGASPISVGSQTTATISGLDPAHSYYFAVTAYNSAGESSYSNLVSVPELTEPSTSISYPASNATVSGTVAITASASDNIGVSRVEFYVNGVLKGTDTSTPYTYSWNTAALAAGSYALMTRAYDAAGNVGQSGNVAVTVTRDTTAPTVTMTSPAANATVSGTVTIGASASDAVGVSRVEFYRDGTLLSASNVAPYSYSWNTTTVANGSHTLSVRAYDLSGNVGQSSQRTVTVRNTISAPTITTASLVSATVGKAYSAGLTASGGVSPYTWSLAAGVLPPGLSLNGTTGAISGTPTSSGTYSVTFRVTDSRRATATRALTITVYTAPAITTASLASATVGKAYSAGLTAGGGVSPYTWSLAAGVLPPGLSLNGTTGAISGTPTSSGTYSVTFRVTDSRGATATRAISITVSAAPVVINTSTVTVSAAPLVINTNTITVVMGRYYTITLSASGGVAPYTWRIAASTAPFGIALNGSTGQLTLVATRAGTYSVTFQVTDSMGATTNKAVPLTARAY